MWREPLDQLHRSQVYPRLTGGEAQIDREVAHERSIALLETVDNNPILRSVTGAVMPYRDQILESDVFGLHFKNPVGLAGGFDKNAKVFRAIGALGFGYVEVGTITKKAYAGQKRPRIFHLAKDRGYINRMGFPGEGTGEIVPRLQAKNGSREFVLGGNFGASATSFKDSTEIEDYAAACREIQRYVDLLIANISSPNTEGVKGMISRLEELLSAIGQTSRPRLVKFSPDVSSQELRDGIEIGKRHGVTGFIMGNTSVDLEIREQLQSSHGQEPGGISGAPIRQKSLERIREAAEIAGDDFPVVAVGGLASARDYWNAIAFGNARLGQSYTGFVEQSTSTPNFAHYINKDLAQAMRAVGMNNLDELRGSKHLFPMGVTPNRL